MSRVLSGSILCQFTALLQGTDVGVGLPAFTPSLQQFLNVAFQNGFAANQANVLYVDKRTLTTGASEDINMYDFGGALDQVGLARTVARVKLLIIKNLSLTNADELRVGGKATSAAWVSPFDANTSYLKVKGNGHLILCCFDATGYVVTNTTNHLLKIANPGGNTVSYQIVVVAADT
jgi:hypothetical protein